jgi:hypothetical protein
MTADGFRELALGLPEATESAHMGHPDFRVGRKIFATLGFPDEKWAMVKLTPQQQAEFVELHPKAFAPVKGEWGRRGATNVLLRAARKPAVLSALVAAFRNIAPKRLANESHWNDAD